MSTVVPFSRDDERLEAASRWIVRLDEGLSAEDEAALKSWLAEDLANPAELIEVAQAWDKLDSLARLADVFPIEQAMARARPAPCSRRRPAAVRLAATACVLAIIAVVWLMGPRWYSGEPRGSVTAAQKPATYETAVGEQRRVRLADGTVVTLNTDSRVRINYTGSARRLELLRGELHVAVAPDPARPLSVYAGDRVAQAVGTAFSVELTADRRVELIVTDGKVLFGVRQPRIEPDAASPPLVPETPGTKTLSAGEELVIRGADEVIVPVSPEDMEIKLAWRDGRLIFRDEPLEQAIAEVERYTTIDFVFLDENLKKTLISGRYKTGDVDSLLLSLRANFDIVYEYSGEDRVLLSSL